jgi:hypothetical protein
VPLPQEHEELRRPPKSKDVPRDLRGKITKKRGTPTSCVIPTIDPTKKHLEHLPTKIPRKGSENQQKEKPRDSQENHKGRRG